LLLLTSAWFYFDFGIIGAGYSENTKYTKDPRCQCGYVVYFDGTNVSHCGIWDLEPYEWCYLAGGEDAAHCPESKRSTRTHHPDAHFWSPAPCRKKKSEDVMKKRHLILVNWLAIFTFSFFISTYLNGQVIGRKHSIKSGSHLTQAEKGLLKPWQVQLLKKFPTRYLSYLWGRLCSLYIPVMLRKPIMLPYIHYFGVKMEEAADSDPASYPTFNEFFTRKLREGARNISRDSSLVSPADCKVLSLGKVTEDFTIEQIKGISYPLETFLGPHHPFKKQIDVLQEYDDAYDVFYCSLYLGPGDYHWFHSPTEWSVQHRRHIPGHLFSVNPIALRSVGSLFNFNERVLLSGEWEHGPLMYAAVGAYNVGSVEIHNEYEEDLKTNWANTSATDKFSDKSYVTDVTVGRADVIGRFNLGSTIVMAFRAPKNFTFSVKRGQKLQYGQALGSSAAVDVKPSPSSCRNNVTNPLLMPSGAKVAAST